MGASAQKKVYLWPTGSQKPMEVLSCLQRLEGLSRGAGLDLL